MLRMREKSQISYEIKKEEHSNIKWIDICYWWNREYYIKYKYTNKIYLLYKG